MISKQKFGAKTQEEEKIGNKHEQTNRFMLFFVPGFVPARDVDVDRERETNFVRQFTDGYVDGWL